MSAATHHDGAHAPEVPYATQLRSNRLGLWLFMFSEAFLFGALLATRFVLWGNTRPNLSQEVGLFATVILLLSSYFIYRSEVAAAHGDRSKFLNNALLSALMGTLFLVMVVVMEWNIFNLSGELWGIELFGHLKPSDGVYGGVFFALTGLHALHVLSGIILIVIIWWNGRRGFFTPDRYWGVEATAVYWHYVDVVWVFVYPALYLMGTAA